MCAACDNLFVVCYAEFCTRAVSKQTVPLWKHFLLTQPHMLCLMIEYRTTKYRWMQMWHKAVATQDPCKFSAKVEWH